MQKKSFLFIFANSPHSNLNAKEGMDFAFSCAAFEQDVDALFINDGIFQLIKNQNTKALQLKNHSAGIEAFSLYGINHCYYDAASLSRLQLQASDLIEESSPCPKDFSEKLSQYDFIYRY